MKNLLTITAAALLAAAPAFAMKEPPSAAMLVSMQGGNKLDRNKEIYDQLTGSQNVKLLYTKVAAWQLCLVKNGFKTKKEAFSYLKSRDLHFRWTQRIGKSWFDRPKTLAAMEMINARYVDKYCDYKSDDKEFRYQLHEAIIPYL